MMEPAGYGSRERTGAKHEDITPKIFAVNTLFLYSRKRCCCMNYKVIALMVVCIAVVAAAGCMGVPSNGAGPVIRFIRSCV